MRERKTSATPGVAAGETPASRPKVARPPGTRVAAPQGAAFARGSLQIDQPRHPLLRPPFTASHAVRPMTVIPTTDALVGTKTGD